MHVKGGQAMKRYIYWLAIPMLLASCSKGNEQAKALDRAASQSDPAAAATLRNQADALRNGDASSDIAAPGSPAQNALQAAGNAAAADRGNRSTDH